MNIGILGAGRVGGALGTLWSRSGHAVTLSARRPERLDRLVADAGSNARAGSLADAAQSGDVVVLAVPWPGVETTLASLPPGALRGKVLIDATNPYGPPRPAPGVSGGAMVAGWAREARVVKAFDMMREADMWAAVASPPAPPPDRITIFYCGDDAAAKVTAARLIEDARFAAADVGPLANAGRREPGGPFYGVRVGGDRARDLTATILRAPARRD